MPFLIQRGGKIPLNFEFRVIHRRNIATLGPNSISITDISDLEVKIQLNVYFNQVMVGNIPQQNHKNTWISMTTLIYR